MIIALLQETVGTGVVAAIAGLLVLGLTALGTVIVRGIIKKKVPASTVAIIRGVAEMFVGAAEQKFGKSTAERINAAVNKKAYATEGLKAALDRAGIVRGNGLPTGPQTFEQGIHWAFVVALSVAAEDGLVGGRFALFP